MAKIDAINRIAPESLEGAPEGEWLAKLLKPVNSFMEQVIGALRGNITIENLRSQLVTLSFTHGTEKSVLAPSFKVLGVLGLYAEGQAVSGVKLAYKQSDQLGLTVYFQAGSGTATARVLLLGA